MVPHWLDTLTLDVRYALRTLKNSPGFAAVAILSLALGIGANVAIFSLLDAVILKYLPVGRPEELMQLQYRAPDWSDESSTFANPAWEQVRDHQDVFARCSLGATRISWISPKAGRCILPMESGSAADFSAPWGYTPPWDA